MRLFYNHEESRLRALIRLLLQFLVFILLSIPLALVPYELSLSAPLWYFPFMGFISAFALFGSVLFACRYLDKRRPASLGLMLSKDWWTDFAFGLLLGIALVSLVFLIELSLGWVRVESFFYSRPDGPGFMLSFGSFLVLFVCVGFYEELLSRGYQIRNLAEGLNGRFLSGRGAVIAAWVISSAVFSVLHAFNPESSLVSTANLFVAGLILGTGYVLTGSLAIPIGLHITWNLCLGNVYGFPVSGLAVPSQFATVVATEQAGPALWTGGAFGPEAGLLGLLMCVTGILATVWWVRFRYGGVGIAAGLADYQRPAAAEAVEPSMDSGESDRGDSLTLADSEAK